MLIKTDPQIISQVTIKHPEYEKTLKSVREALQSPLLSPLIIVYGPPKVGKTKLKEEISKEIQSDTNTRTDVPVIEVNFPFGNKKYAYIDFHQKLLTQLGDPLYTYGLPVQQNLFEQTKPIVKRLNDRELSELRNQTVRLYNEKHCKAVLIDTHASMRNSLDLTEFIAQIRYMQDLAFESKVPHILFAGYEIVHDRNFFTELAANISLIHFRRYAGVKDYLGFDETAKKLMEHITGSFKFPLNETNIFFLYLHSLGCVGGLVQLLQKAMRRASYNGSQTLTIEDVQSSVGYPVTLTTLREYIENGEQIVSRSDEMWAEAFSWVQSNAYGFSPKNRSNKGQSDSGQKRGEVA